MRKNRIAINTAANLVSRAWTMVANYLFVPIYISILGEESYGLITFFATLQTALNLLGLGLSKTLRREFAADESSGKNSSYKYRILRSVEAIYLIIAFIIISICYFGAHFISERYLVVDTIPINTVVLTIRLMGGSIAAQLVANLYLGCLFGLEKQVLADGIQVGWSILKNVGVVFVVKMISANVSTFYKWFLLIDIIYLFVLRIIVIHGLKRDNALLKWSLADISNIKDIWRFAAGIMIISLGYAINTQADKMIISGSFVLTTVGAYNSAYNLGYAASVFVAAMGIAVFPRFTSFFSAKKTEEMKKEFIKTNRISTIVTVSIGIFVAVFSYDLLLLWTGSSVIADTMRIAAIPLIIGTTFNALQEIPYNYYLANGITIVNNIMTICSILYVLFITPLMIRAFGILGASLSWFIQMFLFTSVYLFVFYYKFFREEIKKRLFVDTIIPILISGFTAVLTRYVAKLFTKRPITIIGVAVFGGLINLGVLYLIFCGKKNKELSGM